VVGGLRRQELKEPGALNQAHVVERLREVAELALLDGVVLLGQEPEVVAQREEAFE
jgi:hypothetical protein